MGNSLCGLLFDKPGNPLGCPPTESDCMKLSAKGVDETAVRIDLQNWHNVRRRKRSGRRLPSQRKQRRLQRQAAFRRNNTTRAERMLFDALHGGKLFGTIWRRQHVIDDLIADLYCRDARLIVELHPDGRKWARQEDVDYLNSQGFAVLRFSESEVLERLEWVLELIRGVCHKQLRLATRRARACEEAEKPGEKSAQRVESAAETVEGSSQELGPRTPIRTKWSQTRETVSRFLRARLLSAVFGDDATTPTSIDASRRTRREPAATAKARERGETGRG